MSTTKTSRGSKQDKSLTIAVLHPFICRFGFEKVGHELCNLCNYCAIPLMV